MNNLPNIALDSDVSAYLRQISAIPMLEVDEERELALNLRDNNDLLAAERLVSSHLRLVVKIAYSYKNYGLPMMDMISEGNIGLLKAVKKFDVDKGFRLSTYAIWWIKAHIQEYILNSWSLVKIGTSLTKKKLFFNLGKIKNKILGYDQNSLSLDQEEIAANELGVAVNDVKEMNVRLNQADLYLYDKAGNAEDSDYLIDYIADNSIDQEKILINSQEQSKNNEALYKALDSLNEREKDIFIARKLQENPITLDVLSNKYKISKERVRQIEMVAFNKIKTSFVE
jgi:RNA polymerase sigma-32 factor